MILGVVSVTTATRQVHTIGMLKSPMEVRLWLSRGKPTSYRDGSRTTFDQETNLTDEDDDVERLASVGKYANLVDYQRLPLESSISSLKAAALPRYLLVMAVLLFVVGIGIYELFRWKPWAMVPDLGHRNVFIVFILAVGLYLTYDLVIAVARINDQDKRDKEFNTDSLGGYRRPKELRELEKRLEKVRKRVGLTAKMEDLESRFQADITELRDFKADQQRLGRDLQQNQTEIAQHKANIQQTMQDNDEWMARAKARREARLKAIDDETEARRQQQTLQHEQEGLGDDANVRPGSQHHK